MIIGLIIASILFSLLSSIDGLKFRSTQNEADKSKVIIVDESYTSVSIRNESASWVSDMSKQDCKATYSDKRYLSEKEKRIPPMLYTFPGSGNTWCRLLIDHATGVYSGSIYNDKSLLEALPGEFTCDKRVSVVKVHPHTHDFIVLRDGPIKGDDNKCERGRVTKFQRAVLLIRNPFDSIWSEYQRRVTQSHVEGIMKMSFDWPRWQANAASLSHLYYRMWHVHYMLIEKSLKPSDILYIRYEDLKNKDKRVSTLKKVTDFLKIDVSLQRLECAFTLSNSDKAHRSIDDDLEMTKQEAYTVPLVCRMWNLFGEYSLRHGYNVWGGFNCTGFPKIPSINVGPRGEYNMEWVTPGQKLLDFGGYEKVTSVLPRKKTLSSETSSNNVKSVMKPKVEAVLSFHNQVHGLSIEDAISVSGIANLGNEGPVWN